MSQKSQPSEYDKDFYAWSLHNAALIREGKLSEVDLEHVAEEIEDMGKNNRRELMSRLAVLLAHLLKWRFQPERRGNSWKYTIKRQRFEVQDLLKESPSLKYELAKQLDHAYEKALITAVEETGLSQNTFPETSPFSLTEALDGNFFPDN
jgi:Domain of unknown function DUF29